MLSRFQSCWGILFCVLVAITGCRSSVSDEYRMFYLKEGLGVFNWSRNQTNLGFSADSGKVAAVPVKENDLLYVHGRNAGVFIRYTKDFPDTIQFRMVDSLIYMNDRLVALTIDSMFNMLPFFRQMKPADMKGLRSLAITSNIPADYRPYLSAIANINPAIDLTLMNDTISFYEDMSWLAGHFKPVALFTFAGEAEFDILRQFSTVQDLSLQIEDSLVSKTIPKLKHVRRLNIAFNHRNVRFPKNFLEQNNHVSFLSFSCYSDSNMVNLDSFQQLKGLYVSTNDNKYPLKMGEAFTQLESLVFDIENFPAAQLAGLKKLKELGLPASLPQIVFDSIIKSQPYLEYLQVLSVNSSQVTDFAVLKTANHLKYLIIAGDSLASINLGQLHQLKYLSIPGENFTDTTAINQLQKTLPHTVITPNTGFCMGSGWLLFLVPLVVVGYFLLQRKKKITA